MLVVARRSGELISVSGPPGAKVTFTQLGKAIKLVRSGKEIDYEGAFSPVDFDAKGDVSSATFEIWKYSAKGKIDSLKSVTFRG